MAFTYGSPVALKKPKELDDNGFSYGEPKPLAFGDYAKATYGDPVPMAKLDAPPGPAPGLRKRLLSSVNIASDSASEFEPDDFRWAETKFADDEKPTIYLNRSKFAAAGAENYEGPMVLAESLHNLKNVDPGRYRKIKKAALSSPEYMQWAKESYRRAKEEGEERSFDDWHDVSRLDQVIGGYLFAQHPSIPTMADWSREDLPFGDALKRELSNLEKALSPEGQNGDRSIIIKRPDSEDIEELKARYGEFEGRKPLTSTATGGGPLGLPSPGEVIERRYPGAREKMNAIEAAAWEGQEGSSWGEVFGNTLRNILPKFRRQIVGGMRGGNPVTIEDLQLNADVELDQPGAGTGNISQSIQNQRIAKEWGFEEGSEKVPSGADPVQAFAEWLQSEEGTAEMQAEAAKTPVAMVAQDIWDAETGKINENAIQVKPQSVKYYAAGILDAGINMGPAMAATIITRNPNVGAVIMGGQVYGDTYGSMLDRGYTPDQAMSAAFFSAAAETLTERVPLGVLTSGKYSGLKRILAGATAEGIQEPLTEALQMGYDIGILSDELTMGEAMWRLIDAGIIGFGVGGGMGAGVEMLEQVSTPAAREVIEQEQEIETLLASVNQRAGEEQQLTELYTAVKELDTVVNEAAAGLTEDQLAELETEGLIKVRENGTVQVLPKARRRFNQEQRKLDQAKIEQEAKRRGMDDAEASVVAAAAQTEAEPADLDIDIEMGPTQPQIKAGNYKKGKAKIQGLNISIENPQGSVRRGKDRDGKPWESTLQHHYGYILGTIGKDKDHLDTFIGPTPSSEQVFVINQRKDPNEPLTEENFDEHKIMIGFETADAARDGYVANYAPGWKGLGSMVPVTMDQLKGWMKTGDTKTIFDPERGEQLFHAEPGLGLYSPLGRAVTALKQEKGTPDQMLAMLKKSPGVKKEEIEWSGLEEFIAAQGKSVTKQEISGFVEANGVQVEQVTLSEYAEQGIGDAFNDANYGIEFDDGLQAYFYTDWDGNPVEFDELPANLQKIINDVTSMDLGGIPKFAEHTLPGGKNYREVLLTLPEAGMVGASVSEDQMKWLHNQLVRKGYDGIDGEAREVLRRPTSQAFEMLDDWEARLGIDVSEARAELTGNVKDATAFTGGHFDQPNVLAHIRMNDRTGPNGEKILFVEEIQSDWHQAGRRQGYAGDVLSDEAVKKLLDDNGYDVEYNGTNWVVTSKDGSPVPNRLAGGLDAKNQFAGNLHQVAGMVLGRSNLMPTKAKVPEAPFKGNAWAELSIKRVLLLAAEGGYDQVAWTTGEQQADRYDLSKQINAIEVEEDATRKGDYRLTVWDKGDKIVLPPTDPQPQITAGLAP